MAAAVRGIASVISVATEVYGLFGGKPPCSAPNPNQPLEIMLAAVDVLGAFIWSKHSPPNN